MGLSHAGSTTGSATSSPTTSSAFGVTLVAGQLVIITTIDDSATNNSVSAVALSDGTVLTEIGTALLNSASTRMWYGIVAVGGAGITAIVTWNVLTTGRCVVLADYFNGFVGTPTFDKTAGTTGTSTAANSGATGTPTQGYEIVVVGSGHASTTSAYSLGTGYTNLTTVSVANAAGGQASKIVAAPLAAQTGALTIAASRAWGCRVATFYDTAVDAFGQIGDGGNSSTSSADANVANRSTETNSAPISNGTLISLQARLFVTSGTSKAQASIWDASGNLLATSAEITVSNTTEQELTFTFSGANAISLTSGTGYTYGVSWQDPGAGNMTWSRQTTASTSFKNNVAYVTGSPQNPLGSSTVSGPVDMYVTYTPSTSVTTTKNQLGQARITETTPQAQLGKSRITALTSKLQQGLARITEKTLQTITGKGRITATTPQQQLGKSRITASSQQAQLGKGRITALTTKIIQGLSRITEITSKTITGLARITHTTSQLQQGKARITALTTQAQLGKARVTETVLKTIQGLAKIIASATKNQTGLARITAKTLQIILGVARITAITTQVITGKARITITQDKTQQGLARITITTTKTQSGKGRITALMSRLQTGLARITHTSSQTQSGKARITDTTPQTQLGHSRITGTTLRTQLGKSRLTQTVSKLIAGLSRITKIGTQTQQGKARISILTMHNQPGVGSIVSTTTQNTTGKAFIKQALSPTTPIILDAYLSDVILGSPARPRPLSLGDNAPPTILSQDADSPPITLGDEHNSIIL